MALKWARQLVLGRYSETGVALSHQPDKDRSGATVTVVSVCS